MPENAVSRTLAKACSVYLNWHNGFDYDFRTNGEYCLLRILSHLGIETIFDVGCNVGDWAAMATEHFRHAQIHCFELSEATFAALSRRLGSAPRCILNNSGLSNTVGEIRYKDYGSGSRKNTLILNCDFHDTDKKPPAMKCGRVMTGDSYCDAAGINRIDFLKIDVEGAENLVLEGFAKTLSSGAVRIIQFEYGYANGDAHFLMRDFHDYLGSYGYVIAKVRKMALEFRPWRYSDNDFRSGPNYVAVHKNDHELIQLLSSTRV